MQTIDGARTAEFNDLGTIEGVEREIRRLENDLGDLRKSLYAMKQDALGVKVGDEIVTKQHGRCRVAGFKQQWGYVAVVVHLKKKNGEYGKTARTVSKTDPQGYWS